MERDHRPAHEIWAEAVRTAELPASYHESHDRIQQRLFEQITEGREVTLKGDDVESLTNFASDAIILMNLIRQLNRRGVVIRD